ncbi:MAG: succinate-semialdehyde dehydrogenase (NADP(+)), partial [Hyphomicrobium sp.]
MDKKLITLLKSQAYIDGYWVGEPTLPVLDKATGDEIGRVPALGAAENRAAIEAADRSMTALAILFDKELEAILRRWYDL